MSIHGLQVGDKGYVGNQGSVRVATVTAVHRMRVTVTFKNSVREMTRDVGIVYSLADWLKGKGNTTSSKMVPRFACSPREQSHLDTEPRIKNALPVPEVRS